MASVAAALRRPRTRELLSLIVVGILIAIGFASVYIAQKSQISTASLTYALFFFGLYVAAHVVARFTVPNADPYLLPIAGLLAAVGLIEIYRLGPSSAFKQGLWVVISVGVFAAALILLRRDYRVLEDYKYLFGLSAVALLFLPLVPGIGQTVNGARLWIHAGSLQFQPGELGKIALGLFLVGAYGIYHVTPHVKERVTIWLHPWTTHKVYCPLTNTHALRQDCQS